jgi:hypothetical protein
MELNKVQLIFENYELKNEFEQLISDSDEICYNENTTGTFGVLTEFAGRICYNSGKLSRKTMKELFKILDEQ